MPSVKPADPVWTLWCASSKTDSKPRWCKAVVTECHGPICKVRLQTDNQGHSKVEARMTKDLKPRNNDIPPS